MNSQDVIFLAGDPAERQQAHQQSVMSSPVKAARRTILTLVALAGYCSPSRRGQNLTGLARTENSSASGMHQELLVRWINCAGLSEGCRPASETQHTHRPCCRACGWRLLRVHRNYLLRDWSMTVQETLGVILGLRRLASLGALDISKGSCMLGSSKSRKAQSQSIVWDL